MKNRELYLLHRAPMECARLHADADICDGVVDSAGMLSTAHVRLMGGHPQPSNTSNGRWFVCGSGLHVYPPRDPDNKWAAWTCQTLANYRWMHRLLEGFLVQYQRRYGDSQGRRHASWEMWKQLSEPPLPLKGMDDRMTAFPDAEACHRRALALGLGLGRLVDTVSRHRYAYRQVASHRYYNHDLRPEFMG